MNIYAVIATTQASVDPVRQAVQLAFVENNIAINDKCWLIADPLDVRGVSRKLGVGEPDVPGHLTGVVVLWGVSYWGNADVNIWGWISQKIMQRPTPPPLQPVGQQPTK
jgi:hypothetical protein